MEKTRLAVNPEPRHEEDYGSRQTEAARRVLVDVWQILATFKDCLVLVGGWVPDLLIKHADEEHVGSIDVDLALDVEKLAGQRYAEILKLLVDTRRYKPGEKPFQLVIEVDLSDGEKPVRVEVEFLAPKEIKLKRNRPKVVEGFRVLQADGCAAAFHAPEEIRVSGKTARGATNTVYLQVASLPDFLIMKSFALSGRDKPKDAYDLCYCLDYYPDGIIHLVKNWKIRAQDKMVGEAISILREKFVSVDAYGPMQVVEFHNSPSPEERERQARRAYELVQNVLNLL
jgi:predicted nucleotidyltransferase